MFTIVIDPADLAEDARSIAAEQAAAHDTPISEATVRIALLNWLDRQVDNMLGDLYYYLDRSSDWDDMLRAAVRRPPRLIVAWRPAPRGYYEISLYVGGRLVEMESASNSRALESLLRSTAHWHGVPVVMRYFS